MTEDQVGIRILEALEGIHYELRVINERNDREELEKAITFLAGNEKRFEGEPAEAYFARVSARREYAKSFVDAYHASRYGEVARDYQSSLLEFAESSGFSTSTLENNGVKP